jgi:DNA invertase Pin-like site-specific DNA recombinase
MMYLAYDNQKIHTAPFGGFKLGGYVRLSREDENKGLNASESIQNQKDLILQYIASNPDIQLVDFYEDDDFTGQNFQRDGFERLLADMESGRVNMVITKDLSRLGRDHIETGFYVEKYFPLNKIRYVAITDNVDTFTDSIENDMTPFKLMMNDFYSKDISKKIRATFDTKRRNGVFICGFAPYGYKIETKGSFVIDEPAAAIVRRIFATYCEGSTYVSIAKALDVDGIIPPVLYKKQTSKYSGGKPGLTGKWSPQTIRRILTDKTYIGCMVQNKYRKINYKLDKYETLKKDQWIIVPDMHEPIVTKEIFDMVQILVGRNNTKYTKNPMPMNENGEPIIYQHVLAGLVFCGECSSRMTFDRNKNSIAFNLVCYGYKKKKGCTVRYFITEAELEEFVLGELKHIFKNRITRKELLDSAKGGKVKVELEGIDKQEKSLNKELEQIQNAFRSLYQDKLKGKITERDYDYLYEDFTKNRNSLESNLDTQQQRKNQLMKYQEDSREILAAIDDFLANEILSKTTIHKLISRIETFSDKSVRLYANFSCEETA